MTDERTSLFQNTASLNYIKLYPEDLDALYKLPRFESAVKVFGVFAFSCSVKTGRIHSRPIDEIAKIAGISRSAAYNGYSALCDSGIFEPDTDSMVVKGRLHLAAYPQWEGDEKPEPRRRRSEGDAPKTQSFSHILHQLTGGLHEPGTGTKKST